MGPSTLNRTVLLKSPEDVRAIFTKYKANNINRGFGFYIQPTMLIYGLAFLLYFDSRQSLFLKEK